MKKYEPQSVREEMRVYRYVEAYFERSGNTSFPTVREVCQSCRIRQDDLLNNVLPDSERLFISSLDAEKITSADMHVESYGEMSPRAGESL